MKAAVLSFTEQGEQTAHRIALLLGGDARRCPSGGLRAWTEQAFRAADAIVFVGAAGIAVRAIAPFLVSKASDPAVLVVDETASFVIPIASGHLGGANALAVRLAEALSAVPVITTATDRRGVFAVDVWAKAQRCAIPNPEHIKLISGKLLRGESVRCRSDFPITGTPPAGVTLCESGACDFRLTLRAEPGDYLACVPRVIVLGVGCRRGTPQEALETALQAFLNRTDLHHAAIAKLCSIDLKQNEPGLLAFCAAHSLPLECFSAEELRQTPGSFTGSDFVRQTIGVDNVCERAAVRGSGGTLIAGKSAGNGITLAAAAMPYHPTWEAEP